MSSVAYLPPYVVNPSFPKEELPPRSYTAVPAALLTWTVLLGYLATGAWSIHQNLNSFTSLLDDSTLNAKSSHDRRAANLAMNNLPPTSFAGTETLFKLLAVILGISLGLTFLTLFLCKAFPKQIVLFNVIFSICLSLALGPIAAHLLQRPEGYLASLLGLILLILCFTKNFRKRIELSGKMLEMIVDATKFKTLLLVMFCLIFQAIFSALLIVILCSMIVAMIPQQCLHDGVTAPTCNKAFLPKAVLLTLILGFLCSFLQRCFGVAIEAIIMTNIATVLRTDCQDSHPSYLPNGFVAKLAFFKNFGSIAVAAFISALLETVADVLSSVASNEDGEAGFGDVLCCCCAMVVSCIRSILDSFASLCILYLMLTGSAASDSIKAIKDMIMDHGLQFLVSDLLVYQTFSLLTLLIALVCGAIMALLVFMRNGSRYFSEQPVVVALLIGLAFLIGIWLPSTYNTCYVKPALHTLTFFLACHLENQNQGTQPIFAQAYYDRAQEIHTLYMEVAFEWHPNMRAHIGTI